MELVEGAIYSLVATVMDSSNSPDLRQLNQGLSWKVVWRSPLFWQWIGLNVVGFGLATTLCFSIRISDFNLEMLFLSGLVVGSITGALQPIVLRQRLPRLRYWQWIAANIVGGYIGVFGGGTLAARLAALLGITFTGMSVAYGSCLVFGACVGLALSVTQGVVLGLVGRGIVIWSVGNIAGRAIAWMVGSAIALSVLQNVSTTVNFLPVGISLLAGMVGGGIYGVATGLALPYLEPKAKKVPTETMNSDQD